jgi:hypothetical protein
MAQLYQVLIEPGREQGIAQASHLVHTKAIAVGQITPEHDLDFDRSSAFEMQELELIPKVGQFAIYLENQLEVDIPEFSYFFSCIEGRRTKVSVKIEQIFLGDARPVVAMTDVLAHNQHRAHDGIIFNFHIPIVARTFESEAARASVGALKKMMLTQQHANRFKLRPSFFR